MSEKSIWSALEAMREHLAVSAEWRDLVGDDFDIFRTFLQSILTRAGSLPCNECGCNHKIVSFHDGSLASVCRCVPRECRDKILAPEDTILWQLNWPKFARALSKAFGLQSKVTHFDLLCTSQIGSWSSDTVPVILTIQWDGHELPAVIAELALRLKCRFILLAPTNTHLNAHCQELLAHANSEFFPLDSHLLLTAQGTFQPTKTPGEIFIHFRPEPRNSVGEDVARQVLAVAKRLDSEKRLKPPSVFTVLLMYSHDALSAAQIAQKSHCSKATVISRLNLLGKALGRHPSELRQYSDQFENVKDTLSDPRAKRIHRKGAIHGDDEAFNPEGIP